MALDPSIALGVRPIELPNQLAQYGQMQQILAAQDTQQMNALKMQEARATMDERNMLRRLDPTASDYEAQLFRVNPQLGINYRKEASAAKASNAATSASLAAAAQSKQNLLGQALRDISGRPSDANIIAHAEDIQASSLFSTEEKARTLTLKENLLAIPFDERGTYLASQGAKPGDLKPTITTENLGGTSRVSAIPAFGGAPTVLSTTNKTATPGELLTADTAAEGRKVTIRGQNLVSQRAQERLNAEMATGTLSPQSLDVAANVYLQTGQLPTGLGKAAAGLRTQVMNRATELSTGKPAADIAGGIVEAKQDVAGRGQAVKAFSTGKQGQQINAFNTAIDHLGTMDKLSDALQNGDLKAINTVGNIVARQTGQPAPTNFDAAKQIVTAEVIKAVVASGGGVTERQEAERNFATANSPAQLKGVINTYKQLLGGQLNSLNLQYENTTGRKDFDKKLTPDAKATLDTLRGGAAPKPAAAPNSIRDQADAILRGGK